MTHATYEAMHHEIEAGANLRFARALAEVLVERGLVGPDEDLDAFAAETHERYLQVREEFREATPEPPRRKAEVIQGPW